MSEEGNIFNTLNRYITNTTHGGPFNVVSKTRPTDPRDAVFWEHDIGYGKLGTKAYFVHNIYDQKLLDQLRKSKNPYDYLPFYYFSAKKFMTGLRGTNLEEFYSPPAKRIKMSYDGTAEPFVGPQYISPWRRTSPVGLLNSNRFHARKLKSRYTFTNPKRHRKIKKRDCFKPKDLVDIMCPLVKWKMTQASVYEITSEIGRQGVFTGNEANHICTRGDLKKIYHKLYSDNTFSFQVVSRSRGDPTNATGNVISIPELQSTFASEPTGAQPGRDYFGDRFPTMCCLYYTRQYTFVNPTQFTMYMDVYEWFPKVESLLLTEDASFEWSASMEEATAHPTGPRNNMGNFGVDSFITNLVPPQTSMDYDITDPGRRPEKRLNAGLFKKWKINKTTRLKLEAGSTIKHTVHIPGFKIAYNNLYDTEMNDGGTQWIPDLSINTMFILIGEKCYDNTTGVQKGSYVGGEINVSYKDYTAWRMKPSGVKSFDITTHAIEDFGSAFVKDNYYPVALDPAVAMPSARLPVVDFTTAANTDMEA